MKPAPKSRSREKQTTQPASRSRSNTNRRDDILRAAGTLMAAKGYDATSMRDIASAVGILAGSVYYHFPSKEALFVELHNDVVQTMTERVRAALDGVDDPWERLRQGARAHLEGLIDTDNLVAIISPEFVHEQSEVTRVVMEHRRIYEQIFRDMFDALDLPPEADKTLLRLGLFGSLNWVPVWFEHKGPRKPAQISDHFVDVLRRAYGGPAPSRN